MRISAPAHPSATDGRVSGLVVIYLHCNESKLSLPSHSNQWCHVSGLVTGLVVASFDAMC